MAGCSFGWVQFGVGAWVPWGLVLGAWCLVPVAVAGPVGTHSCESAFRLILAGTCDPVKISEQIGRDGEILARLLAMGW